MAAQNKKSLNKKIFEDLKSCPMTEEEQERFSRFIHNQNFCSAGEMEAILKRVLSLEESEFDKQCGRGVALFEGFYAFLEEADKKGRAIDVLRKHRDNVDAILNDCHDTPQDSYFVRIAGFLNMVVCIIEQLQDYGSFPLSTEQFFMLAKVSNSTGKDQIVDWKALEQLPCWAETLRLD